MPNGRNTIQEKVSGKSVREIADGKKSERGGISNMGGEGKIFLAGYDFWREKGMAPC